MTVPDYANSPEGAFYEYAPELIVGNSIRITQRNPSLKVDGEEWRKVHGGLLLTGTIEGFRVGPEDDSVVLSLSDVHSRFYNVLNPEDPVESRFTEVEVELTEHDQRIMGFRTGSAHSLTGQPDPVLDR